MHNHQHAFDLIGFLYEEILTSYAAIFICRECGIITTTDTLLASHYDCMAELIQEFLITVKVFPEEVK